MAGGGVCAYGPRGGAENRRNAWDAAQHIENTGLGAAVAARTMPGGVPAVDFSNSNYLRTPGGHPRSPDSRSPGGSKPVGNSGRGKTPNP